MSLDTADILDGPDPWSLAGEWPADVPPPALAPPEDTDAALEALALAALEREAEHDAAAAHRQADVPPPPARVEPPWEPADGVGRAIWKALDPNPGRWLDFGLLLATVTEPPAPWTYSQAGAACLALAGERRIRCWPHPTIAGRSVVARGGYRCCDGCGLPHVPPGRCGACGREG